MRILVFGFTDNIGGIETMFMEYYRHMHGNKYHFDFVTIFDEIAFEQEIKQRGSRIYKIRSFKKRPLSYRRDIKNILKNQKYDCVYVNMLSAANIIPLVVSKRMGIKMVVAHSHNNGVPRGIVRKIGHAFNKRKITKYANKLVACSESAGKWLFGDKVKFTVLENLIDKKRFEYNPEYKDLFRKNKNEYIVGHVGRFCEQKNQKFILELSKRVAMKDEKIRFVLIGADSEKYGIRKIIEDEQIKNIDIIDSMFDIEKAYNGFDLFVFPSIFEGLGIAAIEAQINGLTCILSDKIPDIDISGNCHVVKLGDIEEWSRLVLKKSERMSKIHFDNAKYFVNNDNIEKIKPVLGGGYE